MAEIKIETTITITDEQFKKKKFTVSKTFTGLTSIEERDYSLTADATRVIWDPANVTTEVMTNFDFLLAWADGNVDLELVTDEAADNGDEAGTVRLVENMPFLLGADDSYANVTGVDALGTGTLDVIDKIRVKEVSSATRKLKVIMAT